MKFLHLSDLHIGKRVCEVSMLEDQAFILRSILSVVDTEKPQAVIIAGDVYDKSVPPAEAVVLFDEFLWGLSRRNVPVLIISGNHDSPERLSFGGRLLSGAGIHLAPVYEGNTEPITLHDEHGPVDFWLLPFLKPAHVKRFFPEEAVDSYTDACRVAVSHMALTEGRRSVLVTHQFVTGAATCESEELSVGGTDNVDASVFDPFCYVALGHIHGPQNIGSSRIRYCGTPLKYSFSEAGHFKSVTVAELDEAGNVKLETVPLTPRHDLRQLRGSFDRLIDGTDPDCMPADDYLHIVLTDEEDVPEAVGRLREQYPNLLKLTYDNTRTRRDNPVDGAEDVQHRSPLELFEELYQLQNNQPLSEVQRSFMQQLLETIGEDKP